MNLANLVRIDLSPSQVMLSYLLAFALGFLWATVYRKTHSGIAYTRSFWGEFINNVFMGNRTLLREDSFSRRLVTVQRSLVDKQADCPTY